ncbi:putative iron-regulated membrane protein [Pseudoclavibacter sp. JAI123]|uniref:PepSY-associated TM helix domain-containing protein n=1 Tax=Pseudoclavibacter sp. JAI123 TaxID=2723065 RepID=UPI0015C9B583|nr:PepSY-associated TM helix domain-containing protein [Pseudoclavibacter sp. JAI123]NYF12367.1 putative iron-regulated membrane protein [Pseudoclavibacter sp. JAI123]
MSGPRPRARRVSSTGWVGQLLMRLHFLAGVFVGPFILVAALSGALYALTPQLEQLVYDHELHAPVSESALPLGEQIKAADAHVGQDETIVAVRPAPNPGDTTRVMYADATLGESTTRAVFLDPATAEVRGDLPVYGTSGSLPLRTWISELHRSLHLGDAGRLYSELAASWLGAVALAGAGLWATRYRRARTAKRATQQRNLLRPNLLATGFARTRSLHASTGIWVLAGALFLSATGITWSQHGGANFTELRAAVGWTTPALSTSLDGAGAAAADEHAEHAGHGHGGVTPSLDAGELSPGAYDSVLSIAREVNVNTGLVEIRPPAEPGTAWVVQEIQRSFPTEVDAVAIDGTTMQVVDRVDFAEFGPVAKLSRWGIDLHMGSLFGLANQLVLFAVAVGMAAMVVWGYVMWWQRRPRHDPSRLVGAAPPRGALRRAPRWGMLLALAVAVALGMFLPLMGVSLIVFLAVDVTVGMLARRRSRSRSGARPSDLTRGQRAGGVSPASDGSSAGRSVGSSLDSR